MKRFILVFQILAFTLAQTIHAADGYSSTQNPEAIEVANEPVLTQMPENYKLPDMHLLDSVAFYSRFKDQQERRIHVEGYAGRFGATFGEEFKKQIFEIERMNNKQVEIILTLTSTMADAKVLKDRMALVGRKMVIVEIPDEIQKRILDRAEAQAAGGLKELWWDTKNKGSKLLRPIKSINDSKEIFKNQFVRPNKSDLNLAMVSIGSTTVMTSLFLYIGVDPTLALSMAAARILIGGSSLYFYKTINNIFRSDISDETTVSSSSRQTLAKLFILGLGLGEIYYGIGSSVAGVAYKYTQDQLISNTVTSGLIDTAGGVERDKRLSEKANYRMIIYSIVIGSIISAFSTVGIVGPMVLEYGVFQISSLQVGTLAIFTGLFVSYKYFTKHVEKIAQRDLIKIAASKYERLLSLRSAHAERIANEKAEIQARREYLNNLVLFGRNRPMPMCSLLFR